MRFIAFIRGINVVGKKTVRMERLREVLAEAGLDNVKTYIQSGNVAFDTAETDPETIRQLVADTIAREFFPASVMIRTRDEIVRIVDSNPFAEEDFDERMFHLVLLNEELSSEKAEILMARECETESFAVRGREVYCFLRAGVADSTIGRNFFDNRLKVPSTARNWRTMKAVLDL
jgi:uncharacterized protein (DUF1697 family)